MEEIVDSLLIYIKLCFLIFHIFPGLSIIHFSVLQFSLVILYILKVAISYFLLCYMYIFNIYMKITHLIVYKLSPQQFSFAGFIMLGLANHWFSSQTNNEWKGFWSQKFSLYVFYNILYSKISDYQFCYIWFISR